ncbi:MAG: phosphatidylserine decarboxylase, partial [Phycisphaerae bacterium]|nr:phosphatidylserine decarboxylase [Phycisphaerae bacterium]
EVTHNDGAFLDARDPQAIERNESATVRLTYTVDGQIWPIAVRQVAGLVARRIITVAAPGDEFKRGQRFGMIKFGSRLELLVPDSLGGEVLVQPGQRTVAGETVLVRMATERADHAGG